MGGKYEGMKWLKCDLHMHTPADIANWQGTQLKEGEEKNCARSYAEACHQAGLDVIGIVDHNFQSKSFINLLKDAFDEINLKYNHKTTLFPGFEFEAAGVGKGVHVLCLFEPTSDLNRVDSIITECGVSYPRLDVAGKLEKSDKNLKDIINIVQNKYSGIVILPHVMSNDGIFDNDSISEWLQQDQFINPDLLAVEVTKPVHQMSKAFQKLFRSGEECLQGWKRIRPIATLMGSDNKKLTELDENQKPKPNSIGYRFSWIKISDPSIESLRQAFLDHESRIVLPDDVLKDKNPSERTRLATIQSIEIENVAFLANQEVHFSPNLNCIIGGRGSGKSTLLEYLRIALVKNNIQDLDENTKERIKRVYDTLKNPESKLKVCWKSADGVEDCILWQNGNSVVENRDMTDPETFFNNLPVQFYSQQQLNQLTESIKVDSGFRKSNRLLELIDGFTKTELSELNSQERKLKSQIRDTFINLRKINEMEKEYRQLMQECQELQRQWKARSEIQEDAQRHQQLKTEELYIKAYLNTSDKQFSDICDLADTVTATHSSFTDENTPHSDWFKNFDIKVREAKEVLSKEIRDAVNRYNKVINELITEDLEWERIHDDLVKADEEFDNACASKGLTPNDVGHLQEINQSLLKKQNEIAEISKKIQEIKEMTIDSEIQIRQLHDIWRNQFIKRNEAIERANKLAVLNDGGQRFIEVSAKYQQDYQSFCELWQSFAPADGRTRLGKNWDKCGNILYDIFTNLNADSPWQVLFELLSTKKIENDFKEYANDLFQYIGENYERWEKLRCERVQDSVDLKLFRADGSVAGSITDGSLSDGQRNTAALALLLAQEGGPIVIDQPEDELDSNFVYRELIPMLRKVKAKRQLIMATHNANMPVNGDAELVVAFEARDGKGNIFANGGLDQRGVTLAVLDVMEGTEEAFRRRREKYNF